LSIFYPVGYCSKEFSSGKLSNEEWAKKLTPEEYYCTREAGTEAVSREH